MRAGDYCRQVQEPILFELCSMPADTNFATAAAAARCRAGNPDLLVGGMRQVVSVHDY